MLVALSLLVDGCGLFIDLSEQRRRGPDGGVPFDGGPPVEDCTSPGDEDGNQLADCADFACVGVAECCSDENLPPPTVHDWTATDLSGWRFIPASDPVAPDIDVTRRRLIGFGLGDVPRGLVRDACLPLAVGLQVRVSLIPQAGGLCATQPGDPPCSAGLVLSAARDMLPGARLADELGLRIDERGAVRATQAGATVAVAEAPVTFGQPARFDLEVFPSLDGDGRPVLVADAAITQGTRRQVLLEAFPFVLQADLVRDAAPCDDTPGLFLAIEGRGARVHVDPLTVQPLACANPGQFEQPPDQAAALTSSSLGLGPWSAGGIGGPALAATNAGGSVRWDLALEATDVDPDLGRETRVGHALDHAVAIGDAWDTGWTTRTGSTPKAGDCNPSCIAPPSASCAALTGCPPVDEDLPPSLREPALLAAVDGEGSLALLRAAHATELDPVAEVFGLSVYAVFSENVAFPLALAPPVLTPSALVGAPEPWQRCTSLRDPALAAADPPGTATPRHWLFFTCERSGVPSEIHAVLLSPSFQVVDGTQVRLVHREDPRVAAFGSGGVRAPEVLLELDADGSGTLRLWYLARATPGAPATLAVSRGDVPAVGGSEPRLPVGDALVPYPANPVLRADHPALGGCPGEPCELLGAAVATRPDAVGRLRFLVARRVNGGSGVTYELRPIEQAWRGQ